MKICFGVFGQCPVALGIFKDQELLWISNEYSVLTRHLHEAVGVWVAVEYLIVNVENKSQAHQATMLCSLCLVPRYRLTVSSDQGKTDQLFYLSWLFGYWMFNLGLNAEQAHNSHYEATSLAFWAVAPVKLACTGWRSFVRKKTIWDDVIQKTKHI